jgi:uncharacterized protein YneF (UPF0154 family)
MIWTVVSFMAGALLGAIVIAFFIGARILNREIEDWERRIYDAIS